MTLKRPIIKRWKEGEIKKRAAKKLIPEVELAMFLVKRARSTTKHVHACGKEGSLGETKQRLDKARKEAKTKKGGK